MSLEKMTNILTFKGLFGKAKIGIDKKQLEMIEKTDSFPLKKPLENT